MKILILGLFLITSFSLQAQQFVNKQEAAVIADEMIVSDTDYISDNNLDESDDEYFTRRQNIMSYQLLKHYLDKEQLNVEEIMKLAIFELANKRGLAITHQEYDTDNIGDPYLKSLKPYLKSLLTQ